MKYIILSKKLIIFSHFLCEKINDEKFKGAEFDAFENKVK